MGLLPRNLVNRLQESLGAWNRNVVVLVVWKQLGKDFRAQADQAQKQKAQFDPIESPFFSSVSGELSHRGFVDKAIGAIRNGQYIQRNCRWSLGQ